MSRNRLLSLRLTDAEYQTLSSLSVIEDMPISSVIRLAIKQHIEYVTTSPSFAEKVNQAKQRADEAHAKLQEVVQSVAK